MSYKMQLGQFIAQKVHSKVEQWELLGGVLAYHIEVYISAQKALSGALCKHLLFLSCQKWFFVNEYGVDSDAIVEHINGVRLDQSYTYSKFLI